MSQRGAGAIRFARPGDAEQIAAIYAPIVRTTAISFEEDAPDTSEMRTRIARIGARWPWLVAADGDVVTGYAYASEHRARPAYRWSVDTTVYVADGARGRGVGRALYGELLPLLAGRGFYTAFAGIALPNAASVGLHEAAGFTLLTIYPAIGFKLGRWHDVGWWRRALNAPAGVPADPFAPARSADPDGEPGLQR